MPRYYVNRRAKRRGGVREVHRGDCTFLPGPRARVPLGNLDDPREAVARAAALHPRVNGCYYCCMEAHVGLPRVSPEDGA